VPACDRQTDGRHQDDIIYCTGIAQRCAVITKRNRFWNTKLTKLKLFILKEIETENKISIKCITAGSYRVKGQCYASYFVRVPWESSCDVVTRVFYVLSSPVCADVARPDYLVSPARQKTLSNRHTDRQTDSTSHSSTNSATTSPPPTSTSAKQSSTYTCLQENQRRYVIQDRRPSNQQCPAVYQNPEGNSKQ